jgi:hypothetical protein
MRDGAANANACARVSKDEDERPSTPSCFETPRSSREGCARCVTSPALRGSSA